MIDKQIIIDGVDVNALYSDQIACMNRYEVANLFIKTVEQLKAKEQECEELKNEYWKLEQGNDFLAEKNSKLKGCLTEIKEIAEVLITITDEYDNCYHKSECDKCLLGINGDCQYFKVEQILQKISEVSNDMENN